MPTSCAPVGDCISARTPLPSSVVRSTTISATLIASASAEQHQLVGGEARAADRHRLGQVVVAAQLAAPEPAGRSSAPGTSGRSETIRPRASNTSRSAEVRGQAAEASAGGSTRPSAISSANATGSITQRRDAERRLRRPGEEGAEHQELAVGDVQDAHQPVLQVEAERDQRIDAAGDQAGGDELGPGAEQSSARRQAQARLRRLQRRGGDRLRPHHLELALLPLAHRCPACRCSRCRRT